MESQSDAELLRDYSQSGSDAAFSEIVARHAGVAYSAALRQVSSPDLANDITQSVFTDLARKASSLVDKSQNSELILGWLYRSTRYASLNLMRTERRRHLREQQAMEQFEARSETSFTWEHLQPLLDAAITNLNTEDRDVLLLRFFKNQDFRAVGLALGVSDNTAQKRVSRALEKLRTHLSRYGITTSATALSVIISAHAVQAVPVGVGATISSTALSQSALGPAGIAAKTFFMTTTQKILMGATLALLGTGIYEALQIVELQKEVRQLRQEQKPLTEHITQLQVERDRAINQLGSAQNEIARLHREVSDLPRLRGGLALLERNSRELPRSKTSGTNSSDGSVSSLIAEIKQKLQQMPDEAIPELQLLHDSDWAQGVTWANTETDAGLQKCFNHLRTLAKVKFSNFMIQALRAYITEHDGQLPGNLYALNPYFQKPIDETFFSRYRLTATGNASILKTNQFVVEENSQPNQSDPLFSIGMNGYTYLFSPNGAGPYEAISFDYDPPH